MENTFKHANLKFRNLGIHMLLAKVMQFRKQLTVRPEFRQQSGWADAMNVFMKNGLNDVDKTLRRITWYEDPAYTQADMERDVSDTTGTLESAFNNYSPNGDEILGAPTVKREITHVLDGSDVNIPQPTEVDFPNDFGRAFIVGLDQLYVEGTHLDSRQDARWITKYESAMLHSRLMDLFTICMVHGGEENRADIPTGTLPSDMPGLS